MPTIPEIRPTTGLYTSVGIINSILDDPANTELAGIPHATATTESIRMVGQQITSYAARRNQFVSSLINRIGMVRLHYMLFTNPWAWAKQGKLEMGETVEQIWMGLAEVFPYNPQLSENRFLKQAPPDVSTAFHSINYKEVYKVTVNEAQLKAAFLSLEGLRDFIEGIIGSLARSANADEFMAMKYLLAVLMLAGKIKTITIDAITKNTASDVATKVAESTNLFQFPSTEYNMAGVENTTPISDLMVLESARANAQIKVNSLANAFNVDYVKFMGNVVMYDSLGTYNWERMDKIFADDPGYRKFTAAEITLLNSVDIICMDQKFMQIYDSVEEMGTPLINGEGLFTNYFYHVWKIYSASPFHNVIAFSSTTSSVTSVTVSPETATVGKGSVVALTANVVTSGFASSDIIWEISTAVTDSDIDQTGILRIGANETATSITVTATSIEDDSKSGTATITVSAT